MQRLFLSMLLALSFMVAAGAQAPGGGRLHPPPSRMELRPLPAQIQAHYQRLHAVVQPSAQAWMDHQAQIEAKRKTPDMNALRVAISRRFAVPGSRDVEAVAFLVLTQAAQQSQDEEKYKLQRMAEMNRISQALSQMLTELTQQSSAPRGHAQDDTPCETTFCNSLPSRLAALTRESANFGRPIHLQASPRISYRQLGGLSSELNSALGSLKDESELASMELQETMQREQQEIETLSNIEKSFNDTSKAVIQNMK